MVHHSCFTCAIFRKPDRLDVWQRDVPWSPVKQLRTVVETDNSVDDVFAYLLDSFDSAVTGKYYRSESMKAASGAHSRFQLFMVTNANAATRVEYREIGLPWYVTVWCASR